MARGSQNQLAASRMAVVRPDETARVMEMCIRDRLQGQLLLLNLFRLDAKRLLRALLDLRLQVGQLLLDLGHLGL